MPLRRIVLPLALLLGGLGALIAQVVWQRALAQIGGGDQLASGLTLAVFLGGLAAGGALAARRVAMVAQPLRAAAGCEGGLALWFLLYPLLRRACAPLGDLAASRPELRPFAVLLAALILILPAALLMGLTVPLVARAFERDGAGGRAAALAYGANALGACAGALWAGFSLVAALGLTGSLRAAAGADLLAALAYLLAAQRAAAPPAPATDAPARPPRGLVAVAALNGFAVILLEAVFCRMLALDAGASAQIFALTVALFIAGCAAGGAWAGRRTAGGAETLRLLQAGAALWLLALAPLIDAGPWAAHYLRTLFAPVAPAYWLYHAAIFCALLLIAGPAIFLSAAVLPAALRDCAGGAAVARLLAWNALGCLLGGLAGGFVLWGPLDLPRLFLLAPLLLALAALLGPAASGRWGRRLPPLALAGALVCFVHPFGYDPARMAWGTFRLRTPTAFTAEGPAAFQRGRFAGSRLLFHRDGAQATVSVIETAKAGAPPTRALFIDGKSESGSGRDAATLRLSADLPALLAARPARTLVIGLGTGITAGELLIHPGLESLTVAELDPEVIRALPLFDAETRGLRADPRVALLRSDALLVTRKPAQPYDLIISEPTNPWMGGVENLFTLDFYRQSKAALAPGGLFAQWFQLYETDRASFDMQLVALRTVFPSVRAFRGSDGDLIVLASADARAAPDWARAAQRLAANPALQASLGALSIPTLDALRSRELPGFMTEAARVTAPPHTLDHPRLQQAAARAFYLGAEIEPPGGSVADAAGPLGALGARLPAADGAAGPAMLRELILGAARARVAQGLPPNLPPGFSLEELGPVSAPASAPASTPSNSSSNP